MQYTRMAAGTDTGCDRDSNEDSVGILPAYQIAAVADGLGGHRAGEVASKMAIDTVIGYLESVCENKRMFAFATDLMKIAIHLAHITIHADGQKNMDHMGMGTTLTAVMFEENHIVIGHIGDSRCYRFGEGKLTQLTDDHTRAGRMRREDPDQYISEDDYHALEQALGPRFEIKPDILREEVNPGDVFLLCSDGLNAVLMDAEISSILEPDITDPEQIVDTLISRCLDGGAPDNVSIVLVLPE